MILALNRILIRSADIFFSFLGLIFFLIPAIIIAILIKFDSKGPVIFKQTRVGKGGKDFRLLKFRTMNRNAESKGLITVGTADPRITGIGSVLRRTKLDEIPQLYNVLLGEMSLVGPRPEVRKYVDQYSPEHRIVLSVRPGITDFASIKFSNENELLSKSDDPDQYYVEHLIPEKIRLNMNFIEKPTIGNYLTIIWLTLRKLFF
ncbi:MAG: sugar transferase [Bacteroidetes bacterium]|nr:MAG: sugar transferase [Bacteroidota bacterium]